MIDGGVQQLGELAAFAGLLALGQFSPGPDMLLLSRTALREGRAAGCKTAAGIACGLTVHATIAVGGVATAFHRFPMFRSWLKWLGAAYLLWLAQGMLREAFVAWYSGVKYDLVAKNKGRPPFVRGLLCNLLNPKAALFLAAAAAPFLSRGHPDWWPYAIGGIIAGQGFLLWTLWVLLLQWRPLRDGYERFAPWIDALFGTALAALAVVWIVRG